MQFRALTVLAVAGAVLSAGCGASSDATPSRSPTGSGSGSLSKAEFIRQADAICARVSQTEYEEAATYRKVHRKELGKLAPIPAEEKILRAIDLPAIKGEAKELRALGTPKGEGRRVEKIVSEIEAAAEKAKKNPYAVEEENPAENPFREVDVLSREYGFIECTNFN